MDRIEIEWPIANPEMAPRLAPGPQLFISFRRLLLTDILTQCVAVGDEALLESSRKVAIQDGQTRPADIAQPLNSKAVRLGGGKSQLSISFRQYPERQLVPGNIGVKVRGARGSDRLRIRKNLITVDLHHERIFFEDACAPKVTQKRL